VGDEVTGLPDPVVAPAWCVEALPPSAQLAKTAAANAAAGTIAHLLI
jgi:hypothetical protein